jgi:thiol-disulfide isomerase/thioredoxin/YHS domain-containing protein
MAMMATALLLCATLTLSAAPPANDGIKWTAEVDEALRLSQKYHVPVLLHFSSDNCPPCRLLEQRAFKSNDVIKAVHDDYIPVLVNVDKHREIAQKYKVEQWPTDILVNSDGQVIHRGVSPQDPVQYTSMLKKGVKAHRDHLALKIEAAKTASPEVVARSQTITPQASSPYAGAQTTPFSLAASQTGAKTSAQPASIAERITQSPELQAKQSEPAPQEPPASPISTVNPFFAAPAAPETKSQVAPSIAPNTTNAPNTTQSPTAPVTDAAPMIAESASSSESDATEAPIPAPTLEGFCPVSLHEALLNGQVDQAWQEGRADHAVKHRSCIYWFRDEAQLEKFMVDPDKYAAILSGYDLVSFIREGALIPGKREHGYIRDGKLFLFSTDSNKKLFAERHREFVTELQQILMHREAKQPANSGTFQR